MKERRETRLLPIAITSRRKKGLTQEMLSELSGLSQQYVSKLERGKRNPTIVTICELTQACSPSFRDKPRPDK
ncbi:helix-turn-helix transcriptional regulator [Parasphingorhabdus sp.]|uniref:helix-turn-helix domain-containing protein n=1 Tax=Parasphingorhabdus sp. TaxID=2709688 RepID=UPI001B5EC3E6|nr:helix-turn-helix transcriptional regulator [Parasphingorhabdus sp.]MBQ0770404.1 helix-turn-helix transcriptional regulator [Sphingomonadales bacterium]